MKNKIIFFIFFIIIIVLVLVFAFKNTHKEPQNVNTNNIANENNTISENITQNTEENITAENEVVQNTSSDLEGIEIVKQIAPTGFMGSSLYKIVLYSNKEVYLETYDGNGYESSNLVSKDLIAKNVEDIVSGEGEDHYGEVIIKGGTQVKNDIGWIIFE